MGFVEVALDGRVLDSAIYSLDLAIRPRMLRLRQPVLNIIGGAGKSKSCAWKGFCSAIISRIPTGDQELPWTVKWVPLSVRTVWTCKGRPQSADEEVCGVTPRDRLAQFDKGELRGPVDGDKEIELALGGSNLRDVDMEIADRIGLELPLWLGFALDLGSLETPWRCKQRCNDERVRCGMVG